MPLHLAAACKTDVGKQREQNEDTCFTHVVADDQHVAGIFIVADGMGGYHAGEVASKIAVDSIGNALQALLAPPSAQPTVRLAKKGKRGRSAQENGRDGAKTTRPLDDEIEAEEAATAAAKAESPGATKRLAETIAVEHYAERLREAVEQSSEDIAAYGKQHPEARGLGSTVTAALVVGDQAFIANVGDSRTYLLRDGKLTRITRDHSLVERLVEAGQIEPDDVYDHPHRNLIYRSLGTSKSEVDVDIFTEQLKPGDTLLLCSDGLWEMVHDEQIASILREVTDLNEATDLLIQRANENGGEDNITAVLLRCVEG